MIIQPQTRINEESKLSQSDSFNSASVVLRGFTGFSAQLVVSNGNSLVAISSIQVSNDNTNWATVSETSSSIDSPSDVIIYDVTETAALYARVVVTITSGSADFSLKWVIKGA